MEATVVVADTGFVVALLNRLDDSHRPVVSIYVQQSSILLPQTVLAVAYLVGRDAEILTVIAFLKGLSSSRFHLVALTDRDVARSAKVLEDYADSRIDFVDASVMAIAERLNSQTILTLDQRDFRMFRPQHCPSFNLLP